MCAVDGCDGSDPEFCGLLNNQVHFVAFEQRLSEPMAFLSQIDGEARKNHHGDGILADSLGHRRLRVRLGDGSVGEGIIAHDTFAAARNELRTMPFFWF